MATLDATEDDVRTDDELTTTDDELLEEDTTDEITDDELERDEDIAEESELELDEERGALLTEDVADPHRLPLIVGRSAVLPFLLPWKPNEIDWPAAKFPFHETLVAV